MEHRLVVSKRNRGGSPIRGMRTHSGTNARCTCRGWDWFTNEYPPSRGGARDAKVAHARHLQAIDLEA